MHRAFSFPVTVERSRTKERLEASLAGLCELELRKQRQECLVLGALVLGDPRPQDPSRGELACFSSWGQDNLTLRRQLSALQSSPWGLTQMLEEQVEELRIDAGDAGSGFYGSTEAQSPTGRPPAEPLEATSSSTRSNHRPEAANELLVPNGDVDAPALPRSFSAPYPPLEGIAEEAAGPEAWQWEPADGRLSEEDYQQALRVESYILNVIQRHTMSPRPCLPRTTLSPDPPYAVASGHASLHRRTPSLSAEQRPPDSHPQPHVDLLAQPESQTWGCDPQEGEACGGEAPSLDDDCYLALPYPQSRPHSLAGRLPSPLPSLNPNCGSGSLDLFCEPASPQHLYAPPPIHHKHSLVSAQYIPGQACHAPVRSPRHYNPEEPKAAQGFIPPDPASSKSRTSKKSHNERHRSKKSSSKTNRSQSENSLLGQRGLPERRYSTTERHQAREDAAQNQGQPAGPKAGSGSHGGGRRWCSNLELSQDEGDTQTGPAPRQPPRKARHGPACPQNYQQQQQQQQHGQRWPSDLQQRAPLCHGEEGYGAAVPAESESSMSEVYSPASSSLSSDSDESGGLVWPQQLPPRLAAASSAASPSPQANAPPQPKAFVKIKASHALKKKILRFRSGSLKVMTTV